jgi:Protein phosphatase 2C
VQVTMASEPAPGRLNEDYAIVTPTWCAVLDGATAPEHIDSGCVHDVRWIVRQLAGELMRTLTISQDIPLAEALAGSIQATCEAHESTCDLTNPDSPSSTVTILRMGKASFEYLALADSPLIVDTGELAVLVDDRTAHLKDYTYAGVSVARNNPGGFYVASTKPDAAYEAIQGSIPSAEIRRAALLTDGASRLADYFHRLTWQQLMDTLEHEGPTQLIARTREIERAEGGSRRRKPHDDATAVFLSST